MKIPNNFNDALRTPQADQWFQAMKDEIQIMNERHVWDIVPKPNECKVIGCKWVYTLKYDEKGNIARYKARLVAQGFRQIKGLHYDEIYSPVINFSIIRICFSILVCKLNWKHCQLDIKCAYLYATLKENIFMTQPQGFLDTSKSDHVCKLNKAIYGLHQSGREWFYEIQTVLERLNFKRLQWTNCVYIFNNSVILLLYVDDIVLFAKTDKEITDVINHLSENFDLKVLGKTRKLLGVEFEEKGNNIYLHQSEYIHKVCENFKKFNFPVASLPIAVGTVLSKLQCPNSNEEVSEMSKLPYRSLLGSLAFISSRTRPDICYAVNILSQFQTNPGLQHWNTLLSLLGYVHQTNHYKLDLSKISDFNVTCYSDASFASNRDDRISMGGLILFIDDSPILWRTFKQKCVSLSTMEAEYISLTEAAKELVWVIRVLNEFKSPNIIDINFKSTLYCDNQAAINFSKSPIENSRTKHIDIKYHFLRNLVIENLFNLKYVNTKLNFADLFTKPLPKITLQKLINKIFQCM